MTLITPAAPGLVHFIQTRLTELSEVVSFPSPLAYCVLNKWMNQSLRPSLPSEMPAGPINTISRFDLEPSAYCLDLLCWSWQDQVHFALAPSVQLFRIGNHPDVRQDHIKLENKVLPPCWWQLLLGLEVACSGCLDKKWTASSVNEISLSPYPDLVFNRQPLWAKRMKLGFRTWKRNCSFLMSVACLATAMLPSSNSVTPFHWRPKDCYFLI